MYVRNKCQKKKKKEMPILHRLLNEKVKHTLTVLSNHSTPMHLFKRNQSIYPNRNLYTRVHSSFIMIAKKQK